MMFLRVLNIIRRYPKLSFFIGMALATPIWNFHLNRRACTQLIKPIDYRLERGSKSCVPQVVKKVIVPCEDVSKLIFNMYFPKRASIKGHFGVTLGPLGSGKTIVVMDLCKWYPKGVLYMEIVEPAVFAEQLAECIGIRLGPNNLEDLVLGYISDKYRHHYNLPAELSEYGDAHPERCCTMIH